MFVTGTIVGEKNNHEDHDALTLAYGAGGPNLLWSTPRTNLGFGWQQSGNGVTVDPAGDTVYAITSTVSNLGIPIGGETWAYAPATGDLLWHSSGANSAASRAVVATDGAVLIAGADWSQVSGRPVLDFATVEFPAAGQVSTWRNDYDGPGGTPNNAYALAISPDGSKVYITGESQGTSSALDYATLAISR